MTTKKMSDMTEAELAAMLTRSHTISVTFSGEQYAEALMLAERRELDLADYLKERVREERDELVALANAGNEGSAP
jgi:hypothetical protein